MNNILMGILILSNVLLLVDNFIIRKICKKNAQEYAKVLEMLKKNLATTAKIMEFNASLAAQNTKLRGEG